MRLRARMRVSPISLMVRLRRWLRGSGAAMILLAVVVGGMAGLATAAQSAVAHLFQHLFYGVGINRLSALASIRHPWRLLALPAGGLALAGISRVARGARVPIDVVEANALHGGQVPLADSLLVSAQTLVSNGFGASVGLEAAYAQAGGCIASLAGRWLGLRRGEMRVLVGAGAGAAIGATFGAPLTGAFYGFEIVIGAYAPAALAPVMAAALAARLVTRALGVEPWLIAPATHAPIETSAYLASALIGLACALSGIAIMRAQALVERGVARLPVPPASRPVIGGLLLVPIALLCPQALSAGHGAMHLEMTLRPAVEFLAIVFALKALASIVSLSFGFRGGLFFASLFLGSLLGPMAGHGVGQVIGGPVLDDEAAAMIGMAALGVTIVGAPMALSLLVLEVTHDFALTGLVLTAALVAGAFTRARFGYSFSTWRLHLRGTPIRTARDISWTASLTAGRMMRRSPVVVPAGLSIGAFRETVPLGATSRALLVDDAGTYRGMVITADAYAPALDCAEPVSGLARLPGETLAPGDGIEAVLARFDLLQADELAVTDPRGLVLGLVTEKYARRRYAEEIEKAQMSLFGEQAK